MEPVVGFEPTTDGLQNRCSTTELNWPTMPQHITTPHRPSQVDNNSMPPICFLPASRSGGSTRTTIKKNNFSKNPHTGGIYSPPHKMDSDREEKFQKIRKTISVRN
jgi:hypothetical protein